VVLSAEKVVDVVCISYCVGDHKISLASGPLLGDSFHTPYRPPWRWPKNKGQTPVVTGDIRPSLLATVV
jgi:hypothetical protein